MMRDRSLGSVEGADRRLHVKSEGYVMHVLFDIFTCSWRLLIT